MTHVLHAGQWQEVNKEVDAAHSRPFELVPRKSSKCVHAMPCAFLCTSLVCCCCMVRCSILAAPNAATVYTNVASRFHGDLARARTHTCAPAVSTQMRRLCTCTSGHDAPRNLYSLVFTLHLVCFCVYQHKICYGGAHPPGRLCRC